MATDEKIIDKIVRLMNKQENIRNIGTSAHIHHGKTAFSDNLIAAAGMMSQQLAGDALLLNFRQDEIDRCMTIDSANVSMVHTQDGNEFLINLIDTPGHVDFGGDVTRAMRAIDGTILLVCASEGVMPQTETVLKQALRERVKPILFINKVDRLITELKLTPEQIQERFVKIIMHVNQLIRDIAEPMYGEKWQVNVADGSVAFGSARENWALSIPYMKKKGVSFKDIVDIYHNYQDKERYDKLFEKAPLFEVILDMAIKHMPNPIQAQQYRIPKIWHGEVESELGKSLLTCDPKGKPAFVVTKIVIEPLVGEVAYGRLFSGTIERGMELHLNRAKQNQRVQQVFVANGAKRELVERVPSGNILGVVGMKVWVGETLTAQPDTPFEEITHIFEPVISKSIEPAKANELPKLIEVLRKVSKEDPTIRVEINEETGENIISGMGELHLEVVENRIKTERGIDVKTGSPIVVYREAITRESTEFEGKSPNKHNKFYFKVEPVSPELAKMIKEEKIPTGRFKKKDEQLIEGLRSLGWDAKAANKVKAIHKGSVFMESTRGEVHLPEVIEMVIDMFEDVMSSGPLAREPCVNVMVTLTDVKLHEDAIHRGPAQVYPAIRDGIRGAMMQAGPVLYEPLQMLRIEAPIAFMGILSGLVTSKRGQLVNMTQEGAETIIQARMPVAEMFGWSSDLRSATEGRGNFSLIDQTFDKVPNELQPKIRAQIVQRKGLTEGQLGA
ncbi:MAG TPA: elongation factor EF-2 [Candidatus Nanoarchaeia archaeon]|nr:elongation factor EF-2 [Candidatus Nanoarchaeia archaeon]